MFFRGIASDLRKEMWPFLLGIFSWKSTAQERLQQVETLNKDYQKLQAKRHVHKKCLNIMIVVFHRESLKEEAKAAFEEAEVLIEKDVVRTRCHFNDSKEQQNPDQLRSFVFINLYVHNAM